MTAIVAYRDTLPWADTPGATNEAALVEKARTDAFYGVKATSATSSAARNDLLSLAAESDRLSGVMLNKALQFAVALPYDVEQPEVSVDPDGEVAFDWANDNNLLSVSVGEAGRVTYAGKLGPTAVSGTVRFIERLPSSLGDALKSFRSIET